MNVKKYIWPSKRLQRLPIILLTILILYTLIGFFLLPKIIQYKASSTLTQLLDRKTQIEQVHFNPYTFACQIDGLSIKAKEGQENWVAVESILLNLQASSLYHKALILSAIKIEHPKLSATRYSDYTYNFSDLLGNQNDSESKDSAKEPFRFSLNNIQILQGEMEVMDKPAQTKHQITELNFELPSLSNFPVDIDTHIEPYFSARVNNMSFEMDGRTKPFAESRQTKFDLAAQDLALPYYLDYLPGLEKFILTKGELSSNLTITYAQPKNKATYLNVSGELELNNLQLNHKKDKNDDFLTVPSMKMDLSGGNLLAGELNIGQVHVREPRINLFRTRNGTLSIPVLSRDTATTENKDDSSSKQSSEKAFSITMDHFQLQSGKVNFLDHSTSPSFTTNLSNISCNLKDFSTAQGETGSLNASMRIEKQGQLEAQGEFGITPLTARIDMGLEDIDLTDFEPLVKDHVDLSMQNGIFDAQGTVGIQGSSKKNATSLSFQGQAGIIDLKVDTTEPNSDFLSWDRLNLEGIDFESLQPALNIAKIELVGLNNHMIIYEDGASNLGSIFKTKADSDTQSASSEKQDSKLVAVDEFQLSQGNLKFTDQTVSPPFQQDMENLQCTVKDVSNQNEHPSDISLQTNFGRSATLQLNGKANFLGEELFTDLDLALVNIALSPFSPYSGKYIGYAVQKGKLKLDSRLQMTGKEIECDNKLLLDQLVLGKKVDSPQAINAPIKLGIALLKNRNGEIHIQNKVGGNLSNPTFSLGDVVMNVFTNVLVKAATSPFSLLGSMFGAGEEEDLNFVLFSPGQSNLSPKAKEKLQVMGKALYERPNLEVEILGSADTASDKAALRRERLRNMLKQQKLQELKEEKQSKTDLKDIRISEEEYPTYLWKAYKAAKLAKNQNTNATIKKLPAEELEQKLKEHIDISKDDLKQLAINRATEVINFIHQVKKIESKRIFLHNTKLGTSQDKEFRKVNIRLH